MAPKVRVTIPISGDFYIEVDNFGNFTVIKEGVKKKGRDIGGTYYEFKGHYRSMVRALENIFFENISQKSEMTLEGYIKELKDFFEAAHKRMEAHLNET